MRPNQCAQQSSREHPHVLTTTSNLAELVAFTRAVDWAHANRLGYGKPVCIRYDSMYAAHIATGIWKAKKHKPMAQAARQAWARLKRSKEGRAWMKHVRESTGERALAQHASVKHETAVGVVISSTCQVYILL